MSEASQTDCCIVGGGPAGLLLALVLARNGVRVTLLEMHRDFDRDFRGDTVHPATLELLDQLGLADALLGLPHDELRVMEMRTKDHTLRIADLATLPSRFRYVMIMPQAEFLTYIAEEADRAPNFTRLMGATVVGLVENAGRIIGVRYRRDGAERVLHAQLTVGCDGRFSRVRGYAGLVVERDSAPMDVAWFRLPRLVDDPVGSGAIHIGLGRILVMLSRVNEWQLGYVFPKGDFTAVQAQGIEAFRASIGEIVPLLGERTTALDDWDDVHLLTVKSDCLKQWFKPGLLCIGDAAHAMSPVFGVGINYAIADAVVAANLLTDPLRRGAVDVRHLARVQRGRERPTRVMQRLQGLVQEHIIAQALSGKPFTFPAPLRMILAVPGLRRLPGRLVAFGIARPHLDARFAQQPSGPDLHAS